MTKIELLIGVARVMPKLQLYAIDIYILARCADSQRVTSEDVTTSLIVDQRTSERHLASLLQKKYLKLISTRPHVYSLDEAGLDLLKKIFT
jgi:CTP-dependent riboflavin kinase